MMTANDSVADLRIRINGSDLPLSILTDVRSISIQEDRQNAAMFSLSLHNWNETRLAYSWSDSPFFGLGVQVEIWLGYLNALDKVITGEITTIAPSFQAGSLPIVEIRGYDLSHRLRQERKTKAYKLVKISDIARQIAVDAGLVPRVKDSKNRHDYVMQRQQTDMEFLQKQAAKIGFEVYVRHKELFFEPALPSQTATRSLSLEKEIIDFSPSLTVQGQVDKVIVQSWDVKEKKAITAQAAIGDEQKLGATTRSGPQQMRRAFGHSQTLTLNLPFVSKAEADQIAQGHLQESALNFITGSGSCYGRSWLHAGLLINIKGAGKRFSGIYKVTATTHTLNGSEGYRTSFQVEGNASI
jgi:phage protein D